MRFGNPAQVIANKLRKEEGGESFNDAKGVVSNLKGCASNGESNNHHYAGINRDSKDARNADQES